MIHTRYFQNLRLVECIYYYFLFLLQVEQILGVVGLSYHYFYYGLIFLYLLVLCFLLLLLYLLLLRFLLFLFYVPSFLTYMYYYCLFYPIIQLLILAIEGVPEV